MPAAPQITVNVVGMPAEPDTTSRPKASETAASSSTAVPERPAAPKPLANTSPQAFAWHAPQSQPPILFHPGESDRPAAHLEMRAQGRHSMHIEDVEDAYSVMHSEYEELDQAQAGKVGTPPRTSDSIVPARTGSLSVPTSSEPSKRVRVALPSGRTQDKMEKVLSDAASSMGPEVSEASSARRGFLSMISKSTGENVSRQATSERPRSFLADHQSVSMEVLKSDRKSCMEVHHMLSLDSAPESWLGSLLYKVRYHRLSTWLFMEEPWDTLASSVVHGGVVATIIISIVYRISLLDSPESQSTRMLSGWNVAFNSVLFIDLLVRFWAFPLQWRFMNDPKNVIDLMNLIPFLLNDVLDLPRLVPSLSFLEWLSTYETFLRLLKLSRYFSGWHLLFHAITTSAKALVIPSLFLVLIVVFGSCSLYMFETVHSRGQPDSDEQDLLVRASLGLITIRTLPNAVHFSVISILSIGTGPFYNEEAVSVGGKIVVVTMMAFGMLFMAMPIAIVGACFSQTWFDQDRIVLLYKVKSRLNAQGYTPDDLRDVFTEVDADESGEIEFDEFRRMIETFNLPALNVTKCRRLFLYFDHDNDGVISFEDFAYTLYPELRWDNEEVSMGIFTMSRGGSTTHSDTGGSFPLQSFARTTQMKEGGLAGSVNQEAPQTPANTENQDPVYTSSGSLGQDKHLIPKEPPLQGGFTEPPPMPVSDSSPLEHDTPRVSLIPPSSSHFAAKDTHENAGSESLELEKFNDFPPLKRESSKISCFSKHSRIAVDAAKQKRFSDGDMRFSKNDSLTSLQSHGPSLASAMIPTYAREASVVHIPNNLPRADSTTSILTRSAVNSVMQSQLSTAHQPIGQKGGEAKKHLELDGLLRRIDKKLDERFDQIMYTLLNRVAIKQHAFAPVGSIDFNPPCLKEDSKAAFEVFNFSRSMPNSRPDSNRPSVKAKSSQHGPRSSKSRSPHESRVPSRTGSAHMQGDSSASVWDMLFGHDHGGHKSKSRPLSARAAPTSRAFGLSGSHSARATVDGC